MQTHQRTNPQTQPLLRQQQQIQQGSISDNNNNIGSSTSTSGQVKMYMIMVRTACITIFVSGVLSEVFGFGFGLSFFDIYAAIMWIVLAQCVVYVAILCIARIQQHLRNLIVVMKIQLIISAAAIAGLFLYLVIFFQTEGNQSKQL